MWTWIGYGIAPVAGALEVGAEDAEVRFNSDIGSSDFVRIGFVEENGDGALDEDGPGFDGKFHSSSFWAPRASRRLSPRA